MNAISLFIMANFTTCNNSTFIISFQTFISGPCFTSYEHECANGICIMDDLACNGHNPCGDNSDCISESPTEVAVEDDNVLLAAMIAISVVLVCIVVGIIIFCRCYVRRRKTRVLIYIYALIEFHVVYFKTRQ